VCVCVCVCVCMQASFPDPFPCYNNLYWKILAILKLVEECHAPYIMCYCLKLIRRKNKITQHSVSVTQ